MGALLKSAHCKNWRSAGGCADCQIKSISNLKGQLVTFAEVQSKRQSINIKDV
jgi:hypothetical protein